MNFYKSDLSIDFSSDNSYMWVRIAEPERERTSYLLLGASQEFREDNASLEKIFDQAIEEWRNQGESVFASRFHYSPHANGAEGINGILEFLRRKEVGLGR